MTVAGVILAGGLSRRMGGREKSLMTLSGRPPIVWVADALRPQLQHLAINANGDPARFDFLELPVIADEIDGFVGPLAGLHAGMKWAQTISGMTHVITAAADTPFIPGNLCERLQDAVETNDSVVMAHSVGRVHPVFGLWPIHLMKQLEDFLVVEDKRKILEFANRFDLVTVPFDKPNSDPFFNINTKEDMQLAEHMIKEAAS